MQAIHFFIYFKTVEERLKVLSQIDLNIKNYAESNSVAAFKKALIKLCELIALTQKLFGASVKLVLILFYFTIVTNVYWITLAFLGTGHSQISEAVVLVLPNLVILITLGLCDFNFKQHLKHVKAKLTTFTYCNDQIEEILILMLPRDFLFASVGFTTITKVY